MPLTADGSHVEQASGLETSPLSHRPSSPSDIPLSLWLPDYFFALGPWRRPEEQLRTGPLQIDMIFIQDSKGDPTFWGSHISPTVRFIFHLGHEQVWSEISVTMALYDQALVEAQRLFGQEVGQYFSGQVDDAIGRLIWSETSSFWYLPMAFFAETDWIKPKSFRSWDVNRAAHHFQVSCVELVEWMVELFATQENGFSVIWRV